MINKKEYHPNVNGHAVLAIDYMTGKIGQVNVFRTDVDVISGLQFEQYLREIPSEYIYIYMIFLNNLYQKECSI